MQNHYRKPVASFHISNKQPNIQKNQFHFLQHKRRETIRNTEDSGSATLRSWMLQSRVEDTWQNLNEWKDNAHRWATERCWWNCSQTGLRNGQNPLQNLWCFFFSFSVIDKLTWISLGNPRCLNSQDNLKDDCRIHTTRVQNWWNILWRKP